MERRNTYLKTAPTIPVISLPAAKLYLKQDFDTDDALITSIIKTATNMAQTILRGSLMPQTYILQLDNFPYNCRYINLGLGPVQSVTSVKYYDTNGTLQTLTQSGNYSLDNKSIPAVVQLDPNIYWPSTQSCKRNAVEVEYICGYASPDLVPDEIISAIRFLIKHFYDNRDLYVFNEGEAIELPKSAEWLLWPLRDYRWS